MNFFSKSKINYTIPVVAEDFENVKQQILQINSIPQVSCIEIRLDKILVPIDSNLLTQIRDITNKKLIATFRCDLDYGRLKSFSNERLNYLIMSAEAGFNVVDIEYNHLRKTKINEFTEKIKSINKEIKIILSYHSFDKNLKYGVVKNIIKNMKKLCSPNLIKLAFRVDNRTNLNNFVKMLYDFKRMNNIPVTIIGLGKYSKLCRVLATFFKHNLIFLSLNDGLESAKGQISHDTYFDILKKISI